MNTTEALQNLGLTEKEARVYVALLESGQTSAYSVAQKAGLKKPTTYVILGELMQKGLVLKVPRTRKQLFVAKPPDEFFALAEERFRMARGVLPQLMAIVKGQPKTRMLYYEGLAGMREALWYHLSEMKGQELVGFYASAKDSPQEFNELVYEYNDAVRDNGIRMRGIVPEHPSLKRWRDTDAAYNRVVKIIPYEEYSANNSIDIGDTFVRILSFRELQGVIIENPDIAHSVRQIFEMVWKIRPEKERGAAGN